MSKRITIVLPETTIQTIDRMVKHGQRNRFINDAVLHYLAHRNTEALRSQLGRAAVRDQDLDHEVASDWSALRTADYFAERAARGNIDKAKRILKRAGRRRPPVAGDEIR